MTTFEIKLEDGREYTLSSESFLPQNEVYSAYSRKNRPGINLQKEYREADKTRFIIQALLISSLALIPTIVICTSLEMPFLEASVWYSASIIAMLPIIALSNKHRRKFFGSKQAKQRFVLDKPRQIRPHAILYDKQSEHVQYGSRVKAHKNKLVIELISFTPALPAEISLALYNPYIKDPTEYSYGDKFAYRIDVAESREVDPDDTVAITYHKTEYDRIAGTLEEHSHQALTQYRQKHLSAAYQAQELDAYIA